MTSIARKKKSAARVRMANARALNRVGSLRKKAAEMTGDERTNTEEWLSDYRRLHLELIAAIDAVIDDAHPDDKDALRSLRAKYEAKLFKFSQEQEAFMHEQTLALAPPSRDMIDRTKVLSAQMESLIRSQKRAQAIAQLVGELVNLATEVGVTP